MINRTSKAEDDLISIWCYVAADKPIAADRLLNRFEEAFVLLESQPKLGVERQDIAPEMRYFPIGNYLILYRIIDNGIEIVRVVQGKRLLQSL